MTRTSLAVSGLLFKPHVANGEFRHLSPMGEALKNLFRRRLQEEMERAGISANALAARTGGAVGQTTISRTLRGDQDLTIPKVEALAEALGVPAWYLLTDADSVETRVIRTPEVTSKNVKKLPKPYPAVFNAPHKDVKQIPHSRKKL